MENVLFASLTELSVAIREKKISSQEVVSEYLKRIQDVNPVLNAVTQVQKDKAIEDAQRADKLIATGHLVGPLHGVPITIKDSFDTAGVITTGGTKGRSSFIPKKDATIVARLRAAGAIVLAKSNTPEVTLAVETDNLIYGRTNNPYDLVRSPGGSSGGAAAIVAASGSPLDVGSDTGGSIRIPCHFCGIAGIKPTAGRVPRSGHILPHAMGAIDSLTQIGPMARYVEDLNLVLPIISGIDGIDPHIVPVPLRDPKDIHLDSLNIAVLTEGPKFAVSEETRTALENAVNVLSSRCKTITKVSSAIFEGAPDLYITVINGDGRAWSERLLRRAGTEEEDFHPWTKRKLQSARSINVAKYSLLLERVDKFRSAMLSFIQDYDAILSPVCAYPARRHGELVRADVYNDFVYTYTHNLTGWPAVVVRAGNTAESLPIGVQVVARPWREDVALAIAGFIEDVLGGWKLPNI